MNKSEWPQGFSIVLCTHNGCARLQPTLQHLAALQVPSGYSTELLLVDNASTDGTAEMVARLWKEVGAPFELIILAEPRGGKGFAVETGYDAARYAYILTVDDDNWLAPDYLVEASNLLDGDPVIGALQGKSEGVFESEPPAWLWQENLQHYFVIGSASHYLGYNRPGNFGVWGAGMVIRRADWAYLRHLGFTFLTCKLPGKAAGEDQELAMALLMMGRRIYYSDKLLFKHFMPTARVTWEKLRQNFETFGYVSHYYFLYAIVIEACCEGHELTKTAVHLKALQSMGRAISSYTWKQHLAYWFKPGQEYYQLRMKQYQTQYTWYCKLQDEVLTDLSTLQRWINPLLTANPGIFRWPFPI